MEPLINSRVLLCKRTFLQSLSTLKIFIYSLLQQEIFFFNTHNAVWNTEVARYRFNWSSLYYHIEYIDKAFVM
jgi:hypothetical protein